VTLVLSLSRVQFMTALEESSCGFCGTMISMRPWPMSSPRCFWHLR
jgi:hypothetical protein